MRSDAAIPRHWELGLGAFSLCWWAYDGRLPTDEATAKENDPTSAEPEGRGEMRPRVSSWPEAVRAWLEPWVMLM